MGSAHDQAAFERYFQANRDLYAHLINRGQLWKSRTGLSRPMGSRCMSRWQAKAPSCSYVMVFPKSWYSWRHQLKALASAGYCAVAPDMRGYGQTDKPEAIDQYTLLHLTGDMVGLVEALGIKEAVIVGHDWGAPVAWHSALFRPDKFKGVVGLSVPFRPRLDVAPTTLMPQTDDAIFYQLYFQETGSSGS